MQPSPLSAATAHVSAQLHADTRSKSATALLSQLTAARFHPLLAQAESNMRAVDWAQHHAAGSATHNSVASSSASAAAAQQSQSSQQREDPPTAAELCDFEPAAVIILDLSAIPPRVVSCITAFGLEWKPVGIRKESVAADGHGASASSSSKPPARTAAAAAAAASPSSCSSRGAAIALDELNQYDAEQSTAAHAQTMQLVNAPATAAVSYTHLTLPTKRIV